MAGQVVEVKARQQVHLEIQLVEVVEVALLDC